jgi:glyoxylase-like metal-dependent hydrolase (beta-lactamase superfamily II)
LRAPLDLAATARLEALPVAGYDLLEGLPQCRLRAFEAGRLAVLNGGRRTGLTIPILAYVLDSPGGMLAVDCGLAGRWAEGGEPHLGPDDSPAPGTPYLPELAGPTFAAQLDALGLKADRLVCTHLHEDHSGGAAELGLTVEASVAELARLEQPDAERLGYPLQDLAGVPTRPIELDRSRPLGPFPATAEVAGGVLAVDTSGHTPGSISLLACIGPAYALLCGDAVYPRLDQPDSAPFVGALRIRRAISDVRALRLFPGHDTAVLRAGAADGWLAVPE